MHTAEYNTQTYLAPQLGFLAAARNRSLSVHNLNGHSMSVLSHVARLTDLPVSTSGFDP